MSNSIIGQMISLFGLIFLGYIGNKMKVLNEAANTNFSSFLLKIALPATILNSAFGQTDLDKAEIIPTTIMATAVFIVIPIFSRVLASIFKWDATYKLMLNYSNLGFMGFPLVESLYGKESVFYAAIFLMVFNIHIFTVGTMTLQGVGSNWKQTLRNLLSPGILSAIIAFVFVLNPISLPDTVTNIVSSVGNCTTPLAMIVIGSQLAQVSILESLKQYKLYIMAAFKLIVYPAFIYILFILFWGKGEQTEIAAILVGLPVAGNVTMLCSEYDGDTVVAAQGTCITTIISLLTLPIVLLLITKVL